MSEVKKKPLKRLSPAERTQDAGGHSKPLTQLSSQTTIPGQSTAIYFNTGKSLRNSGRSHVMSATEGRGGESADFIFTDSAPRPVQS